MIPCSQAENQKRTFFCGLQLVLFLLRFITIFYSKVLHIVSLSYKKTFFFCHHSLFKYCLTVLPNLMLTRCYLFPHFLYSRYPRITLFKNYLQFLHNSSHVCFIFSSDSSHPNPSFFFFFFLMFIYSRVWTTNFPCSQPKTAEHFAKCLSNSTFGNETVSLSYIRILISKMS